jgi:energy-converting hydrogenase Eha subunit B
MTIILKASLRVYNSSQVTFGLFVLIFFHLFRYLEGIGGDVQGVYSMGNVYLLPNCEPSTSAFRRLHGSQ